MSQRRVSAASSRRAEAMRRIDLDVSDAASCEDVSVSAVESDNQRAWEMLSFLRVVHNLGTIIKEASKETRSQKYKECDVARELCDEEALQSRRLKWAWANLEDQLALSGWRKRLYHTPRLRKREMGDLGGDQVAGNSIANAPPSAATDAVLVLSEAVPAGAIKVNGVDFDQHDKDITVVELVKSMATMGFQATAISDAVRIVNKMRSWRDAETGETATIFLGYTSNLISSGLRETLRFLVQHKHVSAIVTTAGGVEEDLIKCLGHTYLGSFTDQGAALRAKGMNRIGNMIVPNSNYCAFEDWVVPILDKMLEEQEEAKGTDHEFSWTPSKITARLGKEINDKSSVLYWAYKNDIPVFSPALTDGSLGDMMYFRTFKHSPQQLRFDPIEDLRRLNTIAVRAKHAGMIIVGGGIVKHHIANACLMRNGADEAVYINTSQEFDGSDAGARPDEAVSWGKIKATADTVKVYAEATIAFPLIVAATFARRSTS